MNKLVSKNPILRFKLGNKIEKFLTPSRGITINKSEVSRFGPTATRILLGWKNSLFPDIPENDNTIYMSTPSSRRQNTQSSNNRTSGRGRRALYTGETDRGSRSEGSDKNNSASKPINYRTQDKTVITHSNGRLTDLPKNPHTFTPAKTISNPIIKAKLEQIVRKPVAINNPASVVTNRAATGYTLPRDITDVASVLRLLRDNNYYDKNYVNSGAKIDDGIWGKETQAAYDRYKQAVAANSNVTTPNVTYIPTNTGTTVSGNGYSFTLPTNTNTNIYESYYPGTYSNLNNMFTRKGIRSNRGTNYSNVNEYWDWLLNNKDSEDYKVWSNIMGNDGYLNKEIFDNVMSQYGIRGNLGRRDSGRLSNLLNDLNLIGVKGSDARRAFLTNFDRNLPSSEEINEYVKTNTPARPNLSTINWRTTPRTILSNNPFGFSKSEFPHLFAKNGGLISRNPIKRFKSNR